MRLIRHSNNPIVESRLVRKEKSISNQYETLERIEIMRNYLIKKRIYEHLLKSKFGYVSDIIMSYINYDTNTYTEFGERFICKYYYNRANIVKLVSKLIKEEVFYPQFVNFLINISFFWNNEGFYRRNHVYCDKLFSVLINYMIPEKIDNELFAHYYLYH